MTSIGIIYKHNFETARKEAEKLEAWLRNKGAAVFSEEMGAAENINGCYEEPSIIPNNVDCVVVLGGDGTLLGASDRRRGGRALGF